VGSKPDISVVIPAYNCVEFVEDAVSSALYQSGLQVEVIVVDDGSTDNIVEPLIAHVEKIKIIRQPNLGAPAARNRGLRESSAKYIKFLDADDFLIPGALKAQLRHARSLDVNCFSYGRVYRLEEHNGMVVPHSNRDATPDNSDTPLMLMRDPPITAAPLYPKKMLESLGGYDETLPKRQDFDLLARAIICGYRAKPCAVPVYVYRNHSKSSRISKLAKAESFSAAALMFERHVEMLHAGASRHSQKELAEAVARTIWTTGRNALRLGHRPEAKKLFQVAYSTGAPRVVEGRSAYRFLVHVFGPELAEYFTQLIKRGSS
jgi:glycosyltransferase involved in cell wall biosynthesis